MDLEHFIDKYKKLRKFDAYFIYSTSVLLMGAGLFFLYLKIFTDWHESKLAVNPNLAPVWSIYLFSAFMILMGFLLIFNVPKGMSITTVPSTLPLEEKEKICKELVAHLDMQLVSKEKGYTCYSITSKSGTLFQVDFFIDSEGYYYYLRNWNRGFADPFGFMRKPSLEIEEFLKETNHTV